MWFRTGSEERLILGLHTPKGTSILGLGLGLERVRVVEPRIFRFFALNSLAGLLQPPSRFTIRNRNTSHFGVVDERAQETKSAMPFLYLLGQGGTAEDIEEVKNASGSRLALASSRQDQPT